MNEPKRRRWFQLHLSTVIGLALIAGFFLFINLRDRAPDVLDYEKFDSGFPTAYGWPRIAVVRMKMSYGVSSLRLWAKDSTPWTTNYSWPHVAIDALIFILVSTLFTTLAKWLARRKRVPRE